MKKAKSDKRMLVVTMVILPIIMVWNICKNGTAFFDATIYQILSLSFAVVITFMLTQKKNDERRKIDMLEKMIASIQKDIQNPEVFGYDSEESRELALLNQKSLANRIDILTETCKNNKDIEYIERELGELREIYGTHMNDGEYMKKSSRDLKRHIVNIEDKCSKIIFDLYK